MLRQNYGTIIDALSDSALLTPLKEWIDTQRVLQDLLVIGDNGCPSDLHTPSSNSIDEQLEELGSKQKELVEHLARIPARSKVGIIAKLLVWRDLVAYDGTGQDWLQPSDHLVLSVLGDLSADPDTSLLNLADQT